MMRNINCNTTPVQKSKGHSAVAGAAYRAGQNLRQYNAGENGADKVHRYQPKAIVVREAFIMTPDGAPEFMADRETLWNAVEQQETRVNARLGRDLELGFAYELSHDEQRALVREFAQREFVDKGFVADVAIHNYGRTLPAIGASEKDKQSLRKWAAQDIPFLSKEDAFGVEDAHVMEMTNRDGDVTGYKLYQPHCHIRVTPRPVVDGAKFDDNKYAARQFNRAEQAKEWRYEWPKLQNTYLERAGSDVRVNAVSKWDNEFPDLDYLGTTKKAELHAIEQRSHTLTEPERQKHEEAKVTQELDDAFRQLHNDAITDAYLEMESTAAAPPEEAERTRLGVWWHTMSQRFQGWRSEFKEQAEEWQQRFEQQAHRVRQVIGWHDPPAPPEPALEPEQHPPPEPDSQDYSR